jgi:hypothetical protein
MSFTYSPSIVKDDLVLYLDAANPKSIISGDTTWDDLIQSNNGALVNGPTFNPDNNGSIVFDGIDDYVELPQITTNQTVGNYTTSLWFSFTNTITPSNVTDFMIMSAQNTLLNGVDNYIYLLSGTLGRIGFQTFNPFSVVYTTTDTWVGGLWYNVVISYDITTSQKSIYVNGILEGIETVAGCYFNTNTRFDLAAYTDTTNPLTWFFNGKIAKFMVYKKTLSSDEILKNYTALKGRYI